MAKTTDVQVTDNASAQLSQDLLARMAAGDRRSLSALVDLHGRGLRIFCARSLRVAHEAEDVVQDTFLAAWTHAARYDPARGAVATWLYRIALNLCLSRNRRATVRRFLGLDWDDTVAQPPSDRADATRSLAARQRLAQVRAEIAALPARQRHALLLRVVADLEVPAIAEVMGTGSGAVEQLLVRARAKLRSGAGAELDWE